MVAVILASGSPARRSLLAQTHITAHIIVPGVDEAAVAAAGQPASVAAETLLLAQAKGREVIRRLQDGQHAQAPEDAQCILIASDSLLELDGSPVGKPGTPERVREVWQTMGGRTATLHTGHYVALLERTEAGFTVAGERSAVGHTEVITVKPEPAELEAYIATGEPLNVAGALTIDGYGSAFVSSLNGDHTNVIGLSLPLLRTLVNDLGVGWTQLWDTRN